MSKACKSCKAIYETGSVCPQCGYEESAESFKGKIMAINPEMSEIAQKVGIKKKGAYAVKLG